MEAVVGASFCEPAQPDALVEQPLVLHLRTSPTSNDKLVIFVHGLGGSRYGKDSTWGNFPRFLFEDMPDVDVGMYQYRTGLGRLAFTRSVSLPDEEDVAAINAAAPAPAATVERATVELELDGELYTLEVGGTETLLDAALKAGINAPHSCQAGMCASCMCQVVEGEVHLRHNEVLDAKDLAKRWTLSCQALPMTERVKVRFPG